jgi:hypothetical protein
VSAAASDAPRLFDHLDPNTLDAPSRACDQGAFVPADGWGRLLNDRLRTCAFAAAAHLERCWTSQTGAGPGLEDEAVLHAYELVSGYDRAGPATRDVGVTELDALEHWRVRGIGTSHIDAYAAVDTAARVEIATAIERFGGCYAALALPVTAQSQDVWDVPDCGPVGWGAPASWLAHAVALVAYDEATVTAVAWGARSAMTWEFLVLYGAAAYAVVSTTSWFVAGVPPGLGLDLEGLRRALDRRRAAALFYRSCTGVPENEGVVRRCGAARRGGTGTRRNHGRGWSPGRRDEPHTRARCGWCIAGGVPAPPIPGTPPARGRSHPDGGTGQLVVARSSSMRARVCSMLRRVFSGVGPRRSSARCLSCERSQLSRTRVPPSTGSSS